MFDLAALLVARSGLDGITGPGAVDEDAFLPDRCAGLGEAGIHGGFIGDVHVAEHAAEFLGDGFALLVIEVEDRDLDALFGKPAGSCGA